MFAVVCVDTPLTLATTPASPLPMLDGTCTLIWTRPAPTTPAKSTAAGCPPIITVTAFASLLALENTCPAGTAGLAGSFGGNRLLDSSSTLCQAKPSQVTDSMQGDFRRREILVSQMPQK